MSREKNRAAFENTVTGAAGARPRVDIEWLLQWVYAKQLPHYGSLAGAGGGGGDLAALGTKVDGTGAGVWKCDADAEAIHVMVGRLPDPGLIISHGAAMSRPDWRPGARHRFEPVWRDPPSIDAAYRPRRHVVAYDGNRHELFCPVRQVDRPEYISSQ